MVNPNWNLLGSVDVGGAFNQGVAAGQQRRAEGAIDDQFRQMAQNPNAPISNELIRFAPQEAYKLQQQQRAAQAQQQQADLRVSAVRGDQSALEQLAGINLEDYRNLRGDQREAAKAGIETVGQLALMADTAQEWDNIVGQLAQSDPSFQQYIGRFDMRNAIIAQAGEAKALLEQQQPEYRVIPEGGTLVNTRDPAALQQVATQNQQAQQGIPQQAADYLRKNPNLKAEFDAKYGAGASDRVLGGAASNGGGNFQR
jgi:hypothetical protein